MSLHTPDDSRLQQLARDIATLSPRPHHATLLEMAQQCCPQATFRHALTRGGWYRTGGVLAADGTCLSPQLEAWATSALQACDNDFAELVERYAEQGLRVTQHVGRTHYFVAAYGAAPADFLQLEVEELQEVLARDLFNTANPPQDWQELIEPMTPQALAAEAVAAPRYQFRRLIDVRQSTARISLPEQRPAGLPRLFFDWMHSSAAARGHFSDHWLLALREHQDRYRNAALSITLVSRHARNLKVFQWDTAATGLGIATQLQAFDRAAGYPAAWYFHLVASTLVPTRIAYAAARDWEAGFRYLPDHEAALLQAWISHPYSV